jgi:hypothetical protein
MAFTATFSDGLKGSGSFRLTGPCSVCTDSGGLEDFAFSVGDVEYYGDSITYLRDRNALSGVLRVGHDHLVFTPSGHVHYSDASAGNVEVRHGEYSVDADILPSIETSAELVNPIIPNPEPSSLLLLGTTFAFVAGVFVRKKRTLQSGRAARPQLSGTI